MGVEPHLRRPSVLLDIADRPKIEQAIIDLLKEGNYSAAYRLWAEFNAQQPYPLGKPFGVDYTEIDPSSVIVEIKTILTHAKGEDRYHFVVAHFFGELHRTPQQRLLHTKACYARDIFDWQRVDYVKGLKVMFGNSECSKRKHLKGCGRIGHPPPIPHPECDNEFGCTCWWQAIMTGERPSTKWKTWED